LENNGTILKNIEINDTVDRVWEAFTNPQLTKKFFFGCEVHSGFKEGDEISFTLEQKNENIICVQGIVKHCIPKKMLAYTCFTPKTINKKDLHTLVTIALIPNNNKTRLTVTQGSFKQDESRYNQSNDGWNFVLNGLKKLLETKN